MTEAELRQKFVDTACGYLGCKESNGTHKPIIDLYNTISPLPRKYKMSYKDAWCAAFVSAIAQKCGLTEIVFPECGCGKMIQLFKDNNSWVESDDYTPDIGDIIFYDWDDNGIGDNLGGCDHVGIVVSVSNKTIKAIEGNKSDAVAYRTIAINGRYIRGFGVPKFAKVAGTEIVEKTIEKVDEAKKATVTLPVLEYGAKGSAVKTMQRLLIGHGYSCGSRGIDGDFGSATLKALKKYQTAKKLAADGVCGLNTWTSLIAG